MIVTAKGHSGFWVETDQSVFIFDDCSDELPLLEDGKPLYVFVSHRHGDHYHPSVYGWFTRRRPVTYIVGYDVPTRVEYLRQIGYSEELFGSIHKMKSGEFRKIDGITVTSLASTDSGVAFLVQEGETTIFHSGDLHRWIWDEMSLAQQESMDLRYQKQLKRLAGHEIDVAFVVIDGRMHEKDNWKALKMFMEQSRCKCIIPMHAWVDTTVNGWITQWKEKPGMENLHMLLPMNDRLVV